MSSSVEITADTEASGRNLSAARRPGRRPEIDREHLIQAALKLLGPDRSVATLSLREVAREAGIAPNSFYRHFRNVDELAIALIERAGRSLRIIIGAARQRIGQEQSLIRSSVQVFLDQLDAEDQFLHMLLREGTVGSPAFRQTVERQLCFFEEELMTDLVRLTVAQGGTLFEPRATARAMTRLVFAMGARALDMPPSEHAPLADETVKILRMILVGALAMGTEH